VGSSPTFGMKHYSSFGIAKLGFQQKSCVCGNIGKPYPCAEPTREWAAMGLTVGSLLEGRALRRWG
jgi:hypothetical protein